MQQHVTTLYRDPFSIGSPTVGNMKPGLRLSEMVERMPYLPRGFDISGEVRIDDHAVPRALWGLVKPKATHEGRPIVVTFHAAIRGGGEEGKSPLALIGALIITIAAAAVSGGALGPVLGASFATGGTGALIGGIAISVVGNLLITALTPPPSGPSGGGDSKQLDRDKSGAASAGGNIIDPNGPIPRVIGTRKIFPPLLAEPFTYYGGTNGQIEIVEAVFGLSGPHDMSNILIDNAPLAQATDVEIEVREGWLDDKPLNIVQQQTRTSPVQLVLSNHNVLPGTDNQATVATTSPNDMPTFHGAASREAPDQILLHFYLPQGLGRADVDDITGDPFIHTMRVPFRMRIRNANDELWRNLPELHFEHETLGDARMTVKFIFQEGENSVISSIPVTGNIVEARKEVPDQTVSPATPGWSADAYFSSGAGNDYLMRGTEGTSNVTNVTLTDQGAQIWLDTAQFTPGVWQVEVMRGNAFLADNYTVATYFYDNETDDQVHSFFDWRDEGGKPTIPETHETVQDTVQFMRLVSLWDALPVNTSGLALVAIKARNRRIEGLSVLASGYVKDWNESTEAWDTWTTTSNPAPHFHDILTGVLNADPLPLALIDNDSLTDWRTACDSLDYTCDHIAEGERIFDTLDVLGGCGFAKRYQSELWGVIRDYDRSAEGPIQVFSSRNSSGFKFSKAFNRLPDGLRINFQRDDVDYSPAQTIVYRNGVPGPTLEQVTYEGLPSLAKARRRGTFDIQQAELRQTFYSLTAPAESIVCRRGSLVGVSHDVLHNQAGFGRVISVQTSVGNVDGVTLDSEVPLWNEPYFETLTNVELETNIEGVGRKSGAAIRRTTGTTSVHPLSNATGFTDVLTFTTPVVDTTTDGGPFDPLSISEIADGCLTVVGDSGSEYKRLVVSKVDPAPDLLANLTLVDEAQALWPEGGETPDYSKVAAQTKGVDTLVNGFIGDPGPFNYGLFNGATMTAGLNSFTGSSSWGRMTNGTGWDFGDNNWTMEFEDLRWTGGIGGNADNFNDGDGSVLIMREWAGTALSFGITVSNGAVNPGYHFVAASDAQSSWDEVYSFATDESIGLNADHSLIMMRKDNRIYCWVNGVQAGVAQTWTGGSFYAPPGNPIYFTFARRSNGSTYMIGEFQFVGMRLTDGLALYNTDATQTFLPSSGWADS